MNDKVGNLNPKVIKVSSWNNKHKGSNKIWFLVLNHEILDMAEPECNVWINLDPRKTSLET
jgi:hypothetical protein